MDINNIRIRSVVIPTFSINSIVMGLGDLHMVIYSHGEFGSLNVIPILGEFKSLDYGAIENSMRFQGSGNKYITHHMRENESDSLFEEELMEMLSPMFPHLDEFSGIGISINGECSK